MERMQNADQVFFVAFIDGRGFPRYLVTFAQTGYH